jgi:2-polyprenyl-3-methyl-5-hydroxy-6-metoxy-1,4-benzoquinol methylase
VTPGAPATTRESPTARAAGSRRLDLRRRDVDLVELMDDEAADLAGLRRTYAVFPLVNALVAGWRRAYVERLRPLLDRDRPTTLLDLGSGGGDLARRLAGWAARDGLRLEVTAVDPDARAHDFASRRPRAGVSYRCASSGDLVAAGESFDVVVSNHVLHHLDDEARRAVLADSERLATRLALHSDIRRSTSFVRTDGLRSIRRSWHADELRSTVPPRWRVLRRPPFRLWLVLEPLDGDGRP